jgi:REP element-mobilizing transposase RayT
MAPIFHKHPRLRGNDYTRGAYFVTICAHRRGDIFGRIMGAGSDARMQLNDAGLVVLDRWNAIPEHHPGTRLDQLQIMPDHLHAILVLDPPVGLAPSVSTQGSTLRVRPGPLVPDRGVLHPDHWVPSSARSNR